MRRVEKTFSTALRHTQKGDDALDTARNVQNPLLQGERMAERQDGKVCTILL